ncbi:hypothetical protein BDV97DRAFT_184890 [Delphinella strobiligena]|nr:hypothetical protein BDV97DRAFT_184890 [Delphinella strobiligena]
MTQFPPLLSLSSVPARITQEARRLGNRSYEYRASLYFQLGLPFTRTTSRGIRLFIIHTSTPKLSVAYLSIAYSLILYPHLYYTLVSILLIYILLIYTISS